MKTFIAVLTALVAFALAPAMAANTPETVEGASLVSVEDAKVMFEQGVAFVDVRENSDWDAGRIPGAYHLELKGNFSEATLGEVVGKDEKVVIYCNGVTCPRSSTACAKAVSWGYNNVYYFRGGYPDWEKAGFPVE